MTESKDPRINKYLADQGYCSRREAEVLINKGWVKVNGETLSDLSYRVKSTDDVGLDPNASEFLGAKQTIMIHKPLGFVSSQAELDYRPAMHLVVSKNYGGPGKAPFIEHKDFAPAGRLDVDSTGLLILTQEGKVAQKIIGPDSRLEKEYVILVEGDVTPDKIKRLTYGLSLDGKKLKRAKIIHEEAQKIRMVLTEGKKRQIRRMCDLVDLKVTSLRRVRIGQLRLGSLPVGQWRILSQREIGEKL